MMQNKQSLVTLLPFNCSQRKELSFKKKEGLWIVFAFPLGIKDSLMIVTYTLLLL